MVESKDNFESVIDDLFGCFGSFYIADSVCQKFCALRLRCIIQRDKNVHLEHLQDLVFADKRSPTIQ